MSRSGLPADQATATASALGLTLASAVDRVYTSYVWKNVVIVVWFDAATVESILVFERSCQERAQKHPQGMSSVHIMVPGGKSLPTAEARAELSRVMREYAQYSAATAVVIPGTGFWASALRGMITAVSMLARTSANPRICGDFAAVAAWLPEVHEQRTGVRISANELVSALQSAERSGLAAVA